MDELYKDLERMRAHFLNLDERIKEALSTLRMAREWAQDEHNKAEAAKHDAYLQKYYLALKDAEKQTRQAARERARSAFMIFVRAAAAARELENLAEERQRHKRGFLDGVADGMAESTARMKRDQEQPGNLQGWPSPTKEQQHEVLKARRKAREEEAETAKDGEGEGEGEGEGGDDGGMGAGLELAKPARDQAPTNEYARLVAEHRASSKPKKLKRPPEDSNNDSGPSGP